MQDHRVIASNGIDLIQYFSQSKFRRKVPKKENLAIICFANDKRTIVIYLFGTWEIRSQ